MKWEAEVSYCSTLLLSLPLQIALQCTGPVLYVVVLHVYMYGLYDLSIYYTVLNPLWNLVYFSVVIHVASSPIYYVT